MPRSVDHCPHRHPVLDGGPAARCSLLGQISGLQEESLLQVNREECAACCGSFVPTPEDWNPVIASLLIRIAERVEAQPDGPMTIEVAHQLREAALLSLPLVLPDEDDCVDDVQTFVPVFGVTLDQLCRTLPLPVGRRDRTTVQWAVGVTTAPRRQSTLSTSLESLIASGWESPHLFVDGPVEIDAAYSALPRSTRPEPSGAWPAWCWALETLLQADPAAQAILIAQDDALFPSFPTLRPYVEQVVAGLPEPRAVVSLYTSTEDMQVDNGWRCFPSQWKYGAVALVFTRQAAEELLASHQRGELDLGGTAGIDARVGLWATRHQVPLWHPSPSLVQHIGQVSSIWRRSRAVGLRRANRFICHELLPHPAE